MEPDEAVSAPEPAPVPLPAGDEASDLTADAGLLWAVDYGESEHRELTTAEIAAELAAGAIDGQTLVWHDNMPDWLAIRDVKELSAYVPAKREPDAPELPKPPSSQQLVSGKTKELPAAPRATLPFGPPSSQRGPSSSRPPLPPKKARIEPDDQEEVVTSARLIVDPPGGAARPPAPSSPGFPNPLPAAGANPAPAPPAFPPARASQPGPPALPATYVAQAHATASLQEAAPAPATGMAAPPMPTPAAAAPMAGPPMAAPAAPPAAPGALLAATSPASPLMAAPPSAPFAPAVAAPRAATDDIEWPQARSKKPLIIGAIGLCAVIVIAWLLSSGGDEPSVPAPSNDTTQQTASPPEPTPPAPASTPTEPTPTAAENPESPPPSPIAPPGRPSQGTSKGGFADMFEQGAKGAR